MKHRRPIVIANWKMYGSVHFVNNLLDELIKGFLKLEKEQNENKSKNAINAINESNAIEVVLCPPFVYLKQVIEHIAVFNKNIKNSDSSLMLYTGAQNAYCEKEGAFTGEISPGMLNNLGVKCVILGHSERRLIFGETDDLIAKKCQVAYDLGLSPILCLGETLEQRKAGKTFEIVQDQLNRVLKKISKEVLSKLILAYEPIWAIGTGVTATPEEAEEVHAYLRNQFNLYDSCQDQNIRILYGGSVKASNAASLFAQPNIDGFLVGGASLKGQEFLDICQAAFALKSR